MVTDQDFLSRGYKVYPPSAIDPEGVSKLFQRRFDDKNGIKYFITVRKWKPYPPYIDHVRYEYDIQLYKINDHAAVNLEFSNDWSIETVEEFLDTMWNPETFDYYEEF